MATIVMRNTYLLVATRDVQLPKRCQNRCSPTPIVGKINITKKIVECDVLVHVIGVILMDEDPLLMKITNY